ncbi:MAG: ribonuclease H family protein [Bacteroidales bacterium]|nr:ribonuclease H family protein [Bacteroidales bacterium]
MKNKFYTVWTGRQIGVFNSWEECRLQVEGFPGARYKGFPTRESAESAFKNEPDFGKTALETDGNPSAAKTPESWRSLPEGSPKPEPNAIAVDAACSGNPGKMEYRGVYVETGEELFKSPLFEYGTNNIGEFLAIVHCLAWQQKKRINIPIYSDSVNGQKWVAEGVCKTKLVENEKNKYLFEVVKRAEKWLHDNTFRVPIYKWRTEIWGEIPADFGRK